jgi:hypothetical protein
VQYVEIFSLPWRARFFGKAAVESKMDAPDENPEGVSRSVHRGPIDQSPCIGPQTCGLGPRDFFQKNNSLLIEIPVTFAHRTLIFSNINPQSKSFTNFTPRSLVFEFYLQISSQPFNLALKPLLLLQIANLIHQSP